MFKILVGGVDRTLYIPFKSVAVTDSITVKSDSMSFDMEIKEFEVSPPRGGNTVELRYYFTTDNPVGFIGSSADNMWRYRTNNIYPIGELDYDVDEALWYSIEFSGVITTVTRTWVAPPLWLRYTCECSDYTRYFDRHLVSESYEAGQYAGDIVNDIIYNYCDGFYGLYVDKGYMVPEMVFDYEEPSACIDALAEAIGYQWFIDFNKYVHFFWAENKPSPLELYTGNVYYVDTELVYCSELELVEDVSQVKNKIYVKNSNMKSDDRINEDFVGSMITMFKSLYDIFPFSSNATDEERLEYITAYKYNTDEYGNIIEPPETTITKIRIDEVEGKAGDGQGDDETIYINFNRGVRLPDNYPLGNAQVLRIYFNKVETVPVLELSPESISAMIEREGDTDGIYEYAYDASPIYTENGEELSVAVDRVLIRYKDAIYTATFQSWYRGWKAGQHFTMDSTKFGIPGEKINEVMFIKDVSKTILTDEIMLHEITATSNPLGD